MLYPLLHDLVISFVVSTETSFWVFAGFLIQYFEVCHWCFVVTNDSVLPWLVSLVSESPVLFMCPCVTF